MHCNKTSFNSQLQLISCPSLCKRQVVFSEISRHSTGKRLALINCSTRATLTVQRIAVRIKTKPNNLPVVQVCLCEHRGRGLSISPNFSCHYVAASDFARVSWFRGSGATLGACPSKSYTPSLRAHTSVSAQLVHLSGKECNFAEVGLIVVSFKIFTIYIAMFILLQIITYYQ